MLHLRFALTLDRLFEDFCSHVPHILSPDPFSRPTLITGGATMKDWFLRRYSERVGIAADFEHGNLESTLWNSLRPELGLRKSWKSPRLQMLKPDILQVYLMKCLTPELLEEIGARELLAMVGDGEKEKSQTKVLVSARLAQLFLEYERHRPEWFARTDLKQPLKSPLQGEFPPWLALADDWQRKLWDKVFCDRGLLPLSPEGIRYLSLPQLNILRRTEPLKKAELLGAQAPLCCFGITKSPVFHRQMIQKLAEERDVHVWLTNPCAEFWEDVRIDRPRRRWQGAQKAPSTFDLGDLSGGSWTPPPESECQAITGMDEHRLLQLWGESASENVRLWCQVSDYDFEQIEPDPPEASLEQLKLLQWGLGQRSSQPLLLDGSPAPRIPADLSLLWVEAPSYLREMEAVKDLVLAMACPTHPLHLPGFRPEDACLLVADPTIYRSSIEAVFAANSYDSEHLPASIQLRNGRECPFGQAILAMIRLIRGEFSRSDVFTLLRNPSVHTALGMDREELKDLEDLMVELNVFRAMDDRDRIDLGDERPTPIHTWRHAFDRLTAGWMAKGLIGGVDQRGEPQPTISHRPNFLSPRYLATFMDHIEKLFGLSRQMGQEPAVVEQIKLWRVFIDHWTQEVEQQRGDALLRAQVLDFLQQQEGLYEADEKQWSENLMHQLSQSVQAELGSDRNAPAGKMLIAPLRDAEILPHRVIFVAGLDSTFPGGHPHSAIDLMAGARRVGDTNPTAARKEAMLSVVHAAKDRLIYSRRARDIETERDLSPSSMWMELQHILQSSILLEDHQPLVWSMPLLARTSFLGARHAQLGSGTEPQGPKHPWPAPAFSRHEAKLAALEQEQASSGKKVFERAAVERALEQKDSEAMTRWDVKDVCDFLESPLDFHLLRTMGLYDDDGNDEVMAHHEPLDLESLQLWGLHSDALHAKLANGDDGDASSAEQHLEQRITLARYSGELPESPLDTWQLESFRENHALLLEQLQALLSEVDPSLRWMDPTEISERWSCERQLEIQSEAGSWCITHRRPPHVFLNPEDETAPVLLLDINNSEVNPEKPSLLRLWVKALWFKAFGQIDVDIHLVHIGRKKTDGYTFSQLLLPKESCSGEGSTKEDRAKEARRQWQHWLEDMAQLKGQQQPFEHMPFGLVVKSKKNKKGESEGLGWDREKMLQDLEAEEFNYFPKSEAVHLVQSQPPQEPSEICKRRFMEFFQLQSTMKKKRSSAKSKGGRSA